MEPEANSIAWNEIKGKWWHWVAIISAFGLATIAGSLKFFSVKYPIPDLKPGENLPHLPPNPWFDAVASAVLAFLVIFFGVLIFYRLTLRAAFGKIRSN